MQSTEFTVFGNNCDKISNKMESFDKMLNDLVPSVFVLQETKRKVADPPMKSANLNNYQVFESRREKEKMEGGKGLSGGGVAIGALHELNPVLTRHGDDDTECLSVEVSLGNRNILCVTGYGPQLGDPVERKEGFWKYLDEEVQSAKDRDVGILIQIDSNSWAGSGIIPGDPNTQNGNGKLMEKFLKSNPALTVVNSLTCCDGLVTRHRKTTSGEENSVLDVFIVCQKVLEVIKHMKIDHVGHHSLSNFSSKKKTGKVTSSDHYPVILSLDISIPVVKPVRSSHYNFKDKEGQLMFHNMTDNTTKLTYAMSTVGTFGEKVSLWEKYLKGFIFKAFPKIRPRKRKLQENEVGCLLEKRKRLKLNPLTAESEKAIEELEEIIVSKTELEYSRKVKETLSGITG